MRTLAALSLSSLVTLTSPVVAQQASGPVPSSLFETLDWRLVGPFRGGRCAAVCGVIGDRSTYFMGTAGGGVWKTTDFGNSWRNISDGFFTTPSTSLTLSVYTVHQP